MKPIEEPMGTPFGRPGKHWAAGYHTGVDFPAEVGTWVVAAVPGKVVSVGYDAAYGYHVWVQSSGPGVKAGRVLYAHLSEPRVKRGKRVKAGDLIGLSGNTGNSTGPHLHFEVRVAPYSYWDHVSPKHELDYVKPTRRRWVASYVANKDAYGRVKPGGRIVRTRKQGSGFTSAWARTDHLGRVWLRTKASPLWYLASDFKRRGK